MLLTRRISVLSRLALTLCLLLNAACATSRVRTVGGAGPKTVNASPLPGGRLKLSLEPVRPNTAHEVLRKEEAQAVLTGFHAALLEQGPHIQLLAPPHFHLPDAEGWERRLRGGFASRFGLTLLPVPEHLEQSRLFRALKLSPLYMGEGVREAAREMFNSPAFVTSVCLSVLVYFGAWMAPEPFFTKSFAATLTVALAISVGIMEVTHLALACVRLYRDAEAANTDEALEAAAKRFGEAVGGTGFRVLVLVASLGVGEAVPPVPPGGMWSLLGLPQYAVEGGLALEATSTTAQVAADGSLIVSGVAVGEVAERLCRGLAMCATTEDVSGGSQAPKPSTRYGPPHTRENPAHNEAIERELAEREAAGHTELRKNKAQWNSRGERVFDEAAEQGPRFRKPDVSSLRPDGVRHNTNYVSNPKDLQRELEAFEAMVRADQNAIHELYLLDGTLVRRYVPRGVTYP